MINLKSIILNDVLENISKIHKRKTNCVISVVEDWFKIFVRKILKIQCIVIVVCHMWFIVIRDNTIYSA